MPALLANVCQHAGGQFGSGGGAHTDKVLGAELVHAEHVCIEQNPHKKENQGILQLPFYSVKGQFVGADAELIQAAENDCPIRTPEKSRLSAGSCWSRMGQLKSVAWIKTALAPTASTT